MKRVPVETSKPPETALLSDTLPKSLPKPNFRQKESRLSAAVPLALFLLFNELKMASPRGFEPLLPP